MFGGTLENTVDLLVRLHLEPLPLADAEVIALSMEGAVDETNAYFVAKSPVA